jgi:hypothetical protein
VGFPKARTTPSIGSVPFTNIADSVQSLGTALPKIAAARSNTGAEVPRLAATSPAPAPAAEPEPQAAPAAKGSFKLIALGAVAVVLLGVAGFLATRDRSRPVADSGTAAPAAGGAAPAEHEPAPADRFAWPAAARTDFGLKVTLEAKAANKGADGVIRFTAGTPIEVRVKADRDCRVSVWWTDPAGHVLRVFPNEFETDDRVAAGRDRVVPGQTGYEIATTETEGDGPERIRVIATTGDQPAFPPGAKKEQFTLYAGDADRAQLASTVRGLVVKKKAAGEPAAGAVSEAELLFRVQK